MGFQKSAKFAPFGAEFAFTERSARLGPLDPESAAHPDRVPDIPRHRIQPSSTLPDALEIAQYNFTSFKLSLDFQPKLFHSNNYPQLDAPWILLAAP